MGIDASVRAGWIFHFFDFFLGSLKILAVRSKVLNNTVGNFPFKVFK